ncbi:hypothetical protein G9F71_008370 [Clostridium sp. FP2]|uniref:hypothetical protein n=1 Tax=Clostridium sp. FP2 TaxID=2724481 RepID=UPI0013E98896|nr:hypothetical protein [Clostridium sp. FP2]MBZ9622866.1 hypothetical protein [Clostridium sp. FP2]
MKIQLGNGNFQIETDDRQFIVQKKKIVQAGRMTKPENIGKESFEDIGYYTKLKNALNAICDQIVLDNDDLKVIIEKLAELKTEISKMTNLLEISEIEVNENEER